VILFVSGKRKKQRTQEMGGFYKTYIIEVGWQRRFLPVYFGPERAFSFSMAIAHQH
jgi:hypothetical protein